ncbi:MAG: epoxyqueuosine reductase [Proteocatella sp.]
MKNIIEETIKQYVKEYSQRPDVHSNWKEPLFAYAAADDSAFYRIKNGVSPAHALPSDLLIDAKTVIVYFIPFEESIVESNTHGIESSREWDQSYLETNDLIMNINIQIKEVLDKSGYTSTLIPANDNFDKKRLISNWSQRHVAYVAGLGKFGLNRMIITEKGCCGRIGSIVTNLYIEPTQRTKSQSCLYKENRSCMACVKKCVNNALFENESHFDRYRCHEMCTYNEAKHDGNADVCGKCLVGIPCSFQNPVSAIRKIKL